MYCKGSQFITLKFQSNGTRFQLFRHSINSFGFKIHRFNNEVIILVVDFLNFHPLSSLKYILRVKKKYRFLGEGIESIRKYADCGFTAGGW